MMDQSVAHLNSLIQSPLSSQTNSQLFVCNPRGMVILNGLAPVVIASICELFSSIGNS